MTRVQLFIVVSAVLCSLIMWRAPLSPSKVHALCDQAIVESRAKHSFAPIERMLKDIEAEYARHPSSIGAQCGVIRASRLMTTYQLPSHYFTYTIAGPELEAKILNSPDPEVQSLALSCTRPQGFNYELFQKLEPQFKNDPCFYAGAIAALNWDSRRDLEFALKLGETATRTAPLDPKT